METTKPKEMFHEDVKAAKKAFNESNVNITNNSQQQFGAMNGFYSNFFNALMPNRDLWNQNNPFAGTHLKSINLADITKEYKDMSESNLEIAKNIVKSYAEVYKKHLDANIESNLKMMEHTRNQFNSVMSQTENFWTDMLSANKMKNTAVTEAANTHAIITK